MLRLYGGKSDSEVKRFPTNAPLTFALYEPSNDSMVNEAMVRLLTISLSTVITLISVVVVSISRSFTTASDITSRSAPESSIP